MKVRNISDKIHESHNIASRFPSWSGVGVGGGRRQGAKASPCIRACILYVILISL